MAQKKLKASEGSRASESEPDRLSSLPDDVLCHILSFLPTKESVGTRVLSTRWKYLFASVPILNFCCYCHDAFKRNNFIDFVNSIWISYKVSQMEKFHLIFQGSYGMIPPDLCLISSWLCVAIRRHVKEIDFTIQNSYEAIALPRDLLSSKTLSVLKLCGNFKISLPNNVFLPCLKTCELEEVCLSDELAKRLFRSLPALETLELRECDVIEDFQVFNISSPNLKRLRILDCDGEYQIVLNVPNLHYFEFYGFVTKDVVGLETLKSVVDASLSYYEDSGSRDDIFMNLLRALCHVKELALTSRVIEAFVLSGQSLPKFNNLIRLTLGSISSLASKVLSDLLDNTPRLETFSFNQWGADDRQENYSLPERVPDCVSHHLQVVKCLFFAGSEYDRKLLNYFRKNAKNLKDMNIQSRYTYNERGAMRPAARHIVFDSDDIYEIRHEALKEGIHSPQVCTNVHGRNGPEQESMQ